MDTALEHLTKQQFIALVGERDRVIREKEAYESQLLALVDKFKRMAFAQKRERFEGNKDQMVLPFEAGAEAGQDQREAFEKKIEYIRKKKRSAHKGRTPLSGHLPVEEVEIRPDGDLSGMVCIGKTVTEELDYIEKGIPGAGLLASVL